MARSFEFRASDGRVVGDVVMAPIDRHGLTPMVIDAGARNGMLELPATYARRACYVGFEPNKSECQKLVDDTTDAIRFSSAHMPRFRKREFHPTALWSRNEQRQFFITTGTGACTLMGPPENQVAGKMMLLGSDTSHAEEHTKVLEVVSVDCQSLDSLYPADTVIDYLKIDVEGAELEVLNGARALFAARNILFVKSEFVTLPYYREHPLICHQHAFLHDMRYRLLDFDLSHPRYSRGHTTISAECDRRLIQAGDAYFVLDPDRNELSAEMRHRMGAIALALGFNSFGVNLLREAWLLAKFEVDDVERAVNRLPVLARMKRLWNAVPDKAAELLARVR